VQEKTKIETAVALRPGEDVEVKSYYLEALRLQQYAEARVIATVDDLNPATDDLSIIAKLKKAIEGERKEYLSPLQEQVRQINETYKTLILPIEIADQVTREKILAFKLKQKLNREEQEEINRLKIEASQKEMKLKGELTESVNLVEVVPELAKSVSTEMGTSGQRDNWKYEVVDVNLIPREYMMPDTSLLNITAKTHHDKKLVAGVRFYNEPIIAVRAR